MCRYVLNSNLLCTFLFVAMVYAPFRFSLFLPLRRLNVQAICDCWQSLCCTWGNTNNIMLAVTMWFMYASYFIYSDRSGVHTNLVGKHPKFGDMVYHDRIQCGVLLKRRNWSASVLCKTCGQGETTNQIMFQCPSCFLSLDLLSFYAGVVSIPH